MKNPRFWLLGCALSTYLLIMPTAFADYKPPPDQKSAPKGSSSEGATTRGCDGEEILPTLLASRNYVGKTASTHPTFAWYVPNTKPLSMRFTIYDFNSEDKSVEVYSIILQSSPGIMKLSPFAQNKPGLEKGRTYFWQVVTFCDPSSPSSALFDRAYFEIVPTLPNLSKELNRSGNSAEKAKIYAEAGLWYDALAEALKLAPASKLGEVASKLLQELVNTEETKTNSASGEPERAAIAKRTDNLRQIASMTK
jgi:hypothetical protein